MGTKFDDFMREQLKNPEAQREYDALREAVITQRMLAERTGIDQGDISKIETGTANPSIKTLQRLAEGMGMKLEIKFVPI